MIKILFLGSACIFALSACNNFNSSSSRTPTNWEGINYDKIRQEKIPAKPPKDEDDAI